MVVKEALDLGKKVIIINKRKIKDRDHTDGKAEKLYEKIVEKGTTVVKSIDQVIKAINEVYKVYKA